MRNAVKVALIILLPSILYAESTLTPTQPLETNPLSQQFSSGGKNSNTHLYVTQFTDPGATTPNPSAPSLTSLSNWVGNPSQLLSNQVLNRYGVGMQVGF